MTREDFLTTLALDFAILRQRAEKIRRQLADNFARERRFATMNDCTGKQHEVASNRERPDAGTAGKLSTKNVKDLSNYL